MPPLVRMAEVDYEQFFRVLTDPTECPYLPDERMRLDYVIESEMTAEVFEELLSRGWRKQGSSFFRPACDTCRECVSLRIPVKGFRPTKSQRKALKRNTDVRLEVRDATVTPEHGEIYQAYHDDMHERRGWPETEFNPYQYVRSFLVGQHDYTKDFLYYRGEELLAVGIVDVLPNSLSSVYFYHRPEWRPDSPGTFTIQQELRYALETGREYVYLGYWVEGCPSMTYKARFRPHERLACFPGDDEEPVWEAVSAE